MAPIISTFGSGSARGFGLRGIGFNLSEWIATLTPGGATGRFGPSLSQARSGLSITTDASNFNESTYLNDTNLFDENNGIQKIYIPTDGMYRITIRGASGGDVGGSRGGQPREVIGDITLSRGLHSVVVGQRGEGNDFRINATEQMYNSGGGGGSFFYVQGNNLPIVCAGGGGGNIYEFDSASTADANDGPSGKSNDSGVGGDSEAFYSGGSNGFGGEGGGLYHGGGGGGWSGDGAGYSGNGGKGITSNGGVGGEGDYNGQPGGQGGFGGGGGGFRDGSGADQGPGGGGGFSGGAGASDRTAGGGGTFTVSGFAVSSNALVNNYVDGRVKIELLG